MKRLGSLFLLCLWTACTGDPRATGNGSLGGFSTPSSEGDMLRPAPPKPIKAAATNRSIDLPNDEQTPKNSGLQFTLENGTQQDEAPSQSRLAKTRPLGEEPTSQLLARLDPIKSKSDDVKDFALRKSSKPAPRPGRTIKGTFPPAKPKAPPVTQREKSLRVLRAQPKGDIPIGGHLSVTFSAPMVALSSHDELAKGKLPVQLSPQPKGSWRWVGTKTLLFEPEARFPMATEYTLTVPAGVRSVTGAKLLEPFTQRFRTPPPKVVNSRPYGRNQRRDTMIMVAFDQRVDPKAALSRIEVRAGSKKLSTRMVPRDDPAVRSYASSYRAERIVAFRAAKKLPYNSEIKVLVKPGVPSLEGPRKSTKSHKQSFRTYGPFRKVRDYCGYHRNRNCSPGQAFVVEYTNTIDASKFKKSMVKISPKIEGVSVQASGRTVYVSGRTVPQTTYRVQISNELYDIYGQRIDKGHKASFTVGKVPPQLSALGGNFVVSDPAVQRQPMFSIYSLNYPRLRVQLRQVEPPQWYEFIDYTRSYRDRYRKKQVKLPGKVTYNKVLNIKSGGFDMKETTLDLRPALKNAKGNVIVDVRVEGWRPKNKWDYEPRVLKWVQVTNLAVDALVDSEDLIAWVTNLKDGASVAKADVRMTTVEQSFTTDASGLARIPLPAPSQKRSALLFASADSDSVFMPETMWTGQSNLVKRSSSISHRFFVFDDRKLYKPKESVNIKGWIRSITPGKLGDIAPYDTDGKKLVYSVRGPRGNELTKGEAKLTALAGFDFSFKLPDDVNLGTGWVKLAVGNEKTTLISHNHRFQIQEFRKPEFEVSIVPSSPPHFIGEFGTMTMSAKYYSGGGLSGADVNWNFSASTGSYTPPNQKGYSFGAFVPWWHRRHWGRGASKQNYQSFKGTTDAAGLHTVRINLNSMDPPRPMVLSGNGSVRDLNNQTWSAASSFVVHPSSVYVGMKMKRPFVEKGQPIKVDLVRVNLEGEPAPGEVEVVATQTYGDKKDKQTCKVQLTDATPKTCEFKSDKGGTYRVSATTRDKRGRKNQSEMTVWVSGGKTLPKNRNVSKETVELIPDKAEYEVTDTASVLVRAPFANAQGLLSIQRDGILKTERFTVDGTTHVLNIPLQEAYLPNVHISVELVGSNGRVNSQGELDPKLAKRPAYAGATLKLPISKRTRTLTVNTTAENSYLPPGVETYIDVTVQDHKGDGVEGAEVALFVVDEAVLALAGYALRDPVAHFYSQRGAGSRTLHMRQYVQLQDAESPQFAEANKTLEDSEAAFGDMGGGGVVMSNRSKPGARARRKRAPSKSMAAPAEPEAEKTGANNAKIAIRENFSSLAVFSPQVTTDGKGQARVPFKLPDNLTRYRVMAVAVHGHKKFGKGESSVTAAMPVMVRPSPPRFLNFGDRFELPVIVQNQTAQELTAAMVVRATNASFTAGSAVEFKVPPQDRVEIRFPAKAERPGTARFQIAVAGRGFSDAAEVSLPVWTPATTEAFATYGEIDDGAISQKVQIPQDLEPSFGGLELSFASTNLQGLTDAVLYTYNYPYDCAEQRSSRVLSIAALRDVLKAFQADGLPEEKEILRSIDADMKALGRMQHNDGGWGFWGRRYRSWPFVTIHVVHALLRARSKKFEVPKRMLDRGLRYLREIERHIPSTYGPASRRTIIAYALYVRALNGEMDAARAKRVIRESGGVAKLALVNAAWLYPVLSDSSLKRELKQVRTLFNNRATETAATAHFATSYGEGAHLILHSDRRADALILEGLIGDDPKNPLIPKLVRGLLAHRKRGRWGSTQENAWVILALDRYFRTYEKTVPDFFAGAWLNEEFAGGRKFEGRETVRYGIDVPMQFLTKTTARQDLIIGKEGAGRLYYRAGLRYAPKSLKLDPAQHGFAVERRYEAIDDPGDVRKDEDGIWHIKAGAKVRVLLSMTNTARRYHVALVDPLPAGLEPINPALGPMANQVNPGDLRAPSKRTRRPYWWWFSRWYEHQNMRDERVEAFTSLLWSGEHSYVYTARATTRGNFVVPPTKAEEMYFPETFGRSGSDRVIVE